MHLVVLKARCGVSNAAEVVIDNLAGASIRWNRVKAFCWVTPPHRGRRAGRLVTSGGAAGRGGVVIVRREAVQPTIHAVETSPSGTSQGAHDYFQPDYGHFFMSEEKLICRAMKLNLAIFTSTGSFVIALKSLMLAVFQLFNKTRVLFLRCIGRMGLPIALL